MRRSSAKCAIYMLVNSKNGKKYIGETADIVHRISYYKSTEQRFKNNTTITKRPIEIEINKYGFDAFKFYIIEYEDVNKDLVDEKYRTFLEWYYIKRYHTDDPDIGYNVLNRISIHHNEKKLRKRKKRISVPCSEETKILKSKPIFVYDTNTETVTYYSGCKTFGDFLGKERSIIAKASNKGIMTKQYFVFDVNPKKRYKKAVEIIERRKETIDSGLDTNGKAFKSYRNYIEALIAVNEYCKKHSEYEEIDLSFIR